MAPYKPSIDLKELGAYLARLRSEPEFSDLKSNVNHYAIDTMH